jgi:hypothetical protein
MQYAKQISLILSVAGTLLGAGAAQAAPAHDKPYDRSTLELGLHGTHWNMDQNSASGFGLDVRASYMRLAGVHLAYDKVAVQDANVPLLGYATPPDLRAELFLAPIANRYFSPYATAGVGVATYADSRLSILGGLGAEIAATSWLSLAGEWRLVLPSPTDTAEAVQARQKALTDAAKNGEQVEIPGSVSEAAGEYYNLQTWELVFGARYVF